MNLAELSAKVKELNTKVAQYNKVREQEIGAKKVAEQEYAKRVQEYKEAYGVEITDSNIQAEYNNVFNDVAKQTAELEATLKAVEEKKLVDKSDAFHIDEPSVNLEEMIEEAGKKFDTPQDNADEEGVVMLDGTDDEAPVKVDVSTNEDTAPKQTKAEEKKAIYDAANVMNFINGTSGQAEKMSADLYVEKEETETKTKEQLVSTSVPVDEAVPVSVADIMEEETPAPAQTQATEETKSDVSFDFSDMDGSVTFGDDDEEALSPDGWGDEGTDLNALFSKELGESFM